jgi:hypothetical protein
MYPLQQGQAIKLAEGAMQAGLNAQLTDHELAIRLSPAWRCSPDTAGGQVCRIEVVRPSLQ